jgi:hypothetical protein
MTITVPESATEIRPFSVEVSEEELADLLRRIAARQPLRGLAGAGHLHGRGASRIQITALRRSS